MKAETEPSYALLTYSIVDENWNHMAQIDQPHVKSGLLERWGKDQFVADLPHKWNLSFAASNNTQIIGYRIVSGREKINGYAHSHRTSISSEHRLQRIGSGLLKCATEAAMLLGYRGMTGLRHPKNEG